MWLDAKGLCSWNKTKGSSKDVLCILQWKLQSTQWTLNSEGILHLQQWLTTWFQRYLGAWRCSVAPGGICKHVKVGQAHNSHWSSARTELLKPLSLLKKSTEAARSLWWFWKYHPLLPIERVDMVIAMLFISRPATYAFQGSVLELEVNWNAETKS